MRLALFDLDNTLLSCDSDYEWGQFLVDRGVLDRKDYEAQNLAYYEQYVAGTLDIHEYLGFALRPLAEHTAEDLARWHGDFMRSRILPSITPPARALVKEHLGRGDLCAIVTATTGLIAEPMARLFGVDDLVSTRTATLDGSAGAPYSGEIDGEPCYREHKLTRVNQWLAGRGRSLGAFGESWFYSDSIGDLPLLRAVSHPVAVWPDERLRTHAQQAGWQVLEFDRQV
jgi:HAD superfamily hydrolase (TIGR01490 family)